MTKLELLEVAPPTLAANTPEGKQVIEDHKELIKQERQVRFTPGLTLPTKV